MPATLHTDPKDAVAGVVVLYKPAATVLASITSYHTSLAKLFIIDNSPEANLWLVEQLRQTGIPVEYTHLPANAGIAQALNLGAENAVQQRYDWLLTMDQDSLAPPGMVQQLLATARANPEAGIVAPRYLQQTDTDDTAPVNLIEETEVVITSGNLLNLNAFKQAGPFREDFFIDYVDHEYCLRLKRKGYKILLHHGILLRHELGDSQNHTLGLRPVVSSHHNYLRRYYITRNRLAVLAMYKTDFPAYYRFQQTLNWKETLKLLFLEQDKLRKLRSVLRGYLDFKRNRFGKYPY
ncbi:glycosyltransferase family 2 protein [Pontibacter sp. CAU 1760]